jgi:hypothetical protein
MVYILEKGIRGDCMDNNVYAQIELVKNGKTVPIKTFEDYRAYKDIIVDGLQNVVREMYNDIKMKYILPESVNLTIKTNDRFFQQKNKTLYTNIKPELYVHNINVDTEVYIDTNMWQKYNAFRTEMYRTASMANEFDDLDNYFGIMSMPEYLNLLIFAATDSYLTDYIIKAQRKVMNERIKTMDEKQRKLHIEVADLLDQLRMQSRLPLNQQKGVELNKYPTLSSEGLRGILYPCW